MINHHCRNRTSMSITKKLIPMKKISSYVLYSNNQLIALNKPAGMPVQEDKVGDASLHRIAMAYCKKDLYLIHRIDRPSSGIVLFGKTKKAASQLSEQFKSRKVSKKYLAVVKNEGELKDGKLEHFLAHDKSNNKAIAVDEDMSEAQKAIMLFRTIDEIDRYRLLEVDLETGRHHQIRAQLGAIGFPIKGDVKYGFGRGNKDRSIHLHAWKLAFNHPVTGKREELVAPLPDDPAWQAFQLVEKV